MSRLFNRPISFVQWRVNSCVEAIVFSVLVNALFSAVVAQAKTLYVDKDGRGPTGVAGSVSCSDSNPGTSASAPLCTIGAGVCKADMPGDIVDIRASAVPYGNSNADVMDCNVAGVSSKWYPNGGALIAPVHKGVIGSPITIRGHAGERPILDPQERRSPYAQAAYGTAGYFAAILMANTPGRCEGGTRAGLTCANDSFCSGGVCKLKQCYGGSNPGVRCTSEGFGAGCAGGGYCASTPWELSFENLTLQNWDYYDRRLDVGAPDGSNAPPGHAFESQYSVWFTPFGGGYINVAFRNITVRDNEGAGFVAYRTAGLTIEDSEFYNNNHHGYTSAMSHWVSRGSELGLQSVIRRNKIWKNRDHGPPWCLAKMCTDPNSDGDGNPYTPENNNTDKCYDHVNGRGALCPCRYNTDCKTGVCQIRTFAKADCGQEGYCSTGSSRGGGSCAFDNGEAPGDSSECAVTGAKCQWYDDGMTEGNGIIIDRGAGRCSTAPYAVCFYNGDPTCGTGFCKMGEAANVLIENNIIWGNGQACVNSFLSANVIVRNNTCYKNNANLSPDFGEITLFGARDQNVNNIVVTQDYGTCTCGSDTDCSVTPAVRTGSCWLWNAWGKMCRNGPRNRCVNDSECAAGQVCLNNPAQKLTYINSSAGAGQMSYAYPADYKVSGNLYWNQARPDAKLIWNSDAGYGTGLTRHTSLGFKSFAHAVTYGWAGNGASANFRAADPAFVDPGMTQTEDFRPTSGSPVLGGGDNAWKALADILGVSRGNPPSIGAYEQPSGGASPLVPPSGLRVVP